MISASIKRVGLSDNYKISSISGDIELTCGKECFSVGETIPKAIAKKLCQKKEYKITSR